MKRSKEEKLRGGRGEREEKERQKKVRIGLNSDMDNMKQ